VYDPVSPLPWLINLVYESTSLYVWGVLTVLQAASSNVVACAPVTSWRMNRQPGSRLNCAELVVDAAPPAPPEPLPA